MKLQLQSLPLSCTISSTSMRASSSIESAWYGGSPSRSSPAGKSSHNTPVHDPLQRQLESSVERRRLSRRDTLSRQSLGHPYSEESEQMIRDFQKILLQSTYDAAQRFDSTSEEQARIHAEQLANAAAEHAKVRERAQAEKDRVEKEQEMIRRQEEERQRLELEHIEKELARQEAEKRKREVETMRRKEEEARLAAEQVRQLKESEARIKALEEKNAADLRQKIQQEQAQRKAKEEAEKTQLQQAQQAQQAQQLSKAVVIPPATATTTASRPTPSAPSNAERDRLHQQYLDLHKHLKSFRQWCVTEAKKKDTLKTLIGDLRRDLRTRAGQITADRNASRSTIAKIRDALNKAKETGPLMSVDIRPFIVSQPIPQLANDAEAQYPAMLLYLLNVFSKFILAQCIGEASKDDGNIVQEIGLIAASIFADPSYAWKDISMIDLMLAKYHRVCPVLFGISGREDTVQGRERLGWLPVQGQPRDLNQHTQRMLGLGAGFASMSLRGFKNRPAIPMSAYWRAVTSIINMPNEQLTNTHLIVLKGLLRDYAGKFIDFYGNAAVAVLREATIELPKRATGNSAATANSLSVLPDIWKKTLNFTLQQELV